MYPTNAVLNVTNTCNMRCSYCFTCPNNSHMSLETAKKVVLWLVENYEKEPKDTPPSINFFGGEPTLRFEELIKPLMVWARDKIKLSTKKEIRWGMTTNGVLLDETRLKFLSSFPTFSILLSIDGAEKSQNIQRKMANGADSFLLVAKNIPLILKYFPNTTFRSTITPKTAGLLSENYFFAKSQGFKTFFCTPNVREEWSEEATENLVKEVSYIIYNQYLDIIRKAPNILRFLLFERELKKILINDGTDIKKMNHLSCGFGVRSVGIGTQGEITACQEQNTHEKNIFYIGHIDTGIDPAKHEKLLNLLNQKDVIENSEKDLCINCPLRQSCSSYSCPSTSYDLFGEINIVNKMRCKWLLLNNQLAKTILEINSKSSKEDQNALINWMKGK
ncbi:radical SAM protein [Massilibacteroides sp.]|uniref:radical SAM protein n=1 Tax=Massilibacteroides sp. TaxID=2034766 RepID=UPI00261EDE99|nr:radical SAM protein [Massilibacteroides sp.]MDD4516347.1 radical SAM protein [Massilibacteroides sp.]